MYVINIAYNLPYEMSTDSRHFVNYSPICTCINTYHNVMDGLIYSLLNVATHEARHSYAVSQL